MIWLIIAVCVVLYLWMGHRTRRWFLVRMYTSWYKRKQYIWGQRDYPGTPDHLQRMYLETYINGVDKYDDADARIIGGFFSFVVWPLFLPILCCMRLIGKCKERAAQGERTHSAEYVTTQAVKQLCKDAAPPAPKVDKKDRKIKELEEQVQQLKDRIYELED